MVNRSRYSLILGVLGSVTIACGSTTPATGQQGSGGTPRAGGSTGSGGQAGTATGGTATAGGTSSTGGASTGGSVFTGGTVSTVGTVPAGTGGTTGRGGATTSGGTTGAGGTGGTPATGGTTERVGTTASGGTTGAGGTTATGGTAGRGGATATGGATRTGGTPATGGTTTTGTSTSAKFSFFVTSITAMRKLSGNQNGFGGDLRYGQANGLAGADKICTEIAESSMAGSSTKGWRAFLSTSTVNAIDRVGTGPWYDRLGRIVANTTADLQSSRPVGADTAIINDLPNETGVPNHNPDKTGQVDNHDTLTGSNMQGKYYGSASSTCNDWTSLSGGSPRVGHSWPGGPSQNWSDAMSAPGCAAGVNLSESGNSGTAVGSAGGYGGIYCLALMP